MITRKTMSTLDSETTQKKNLINIVNQEKPYRTSQQT